MISASAVGSFGGASRIASAVETIALTISPASSWRSSVRPAVEVGEAREVGREVAREQADLAADRVPQRGDAAEALARDEAEVRVVLVHVVDEDLDRVADHVLVGPRVRARRADHRPQRAERLVDQDEAELLHVVEVAIEGRRDDAGRARHLAQAEAREALLLEQLERRIEQRPARALLALLTRSAVFWSTVVHDHSVTRLTDVSIA